MAVLVSGLVIAAFAYYYNTKETQEFEARKAIEDKVKVVAYYKDKDCDVGYPYFYGIVNESEKEVKSVKFTVEINRKGFSSPLNSFTSITEDKILKPGEGYGRCFRATAQNYTDQVMEKDVDIVITYKNVDFSN